MDIKLYNAKGHGNGMKYEGDELRIEHIKEIQRNAIEVALFYASEHADADYNIVDTSISIKPEIEVYVINSSILNCKDEIFKLNNL